MPLLHALDVAARARVPLCAAAGGLRYANHFDLRRDIQFDTPVRIVGCEPTHTLNTERCPTLEHRRSRGSEREHFMKTFVVAIPLSAPYPAMLSSSDRLRYCLAKRQNPQGKGARPLL
jgi:hypothetical protein